MIKKPISPNFEHSNRFLTDYIPQKFAFTYAYVATPGSGCIKHFKIKGTRNFYFKTIGYCFRTKVTSPLILRRLYATWPTSLEIGSWSHLVFIAEYHSKELYEIFC